jgi:hypothetical protein
MDKDTFFCLITLSRMSKQPCKKQGQQHGMHSQASKDVVNQGAVVVYYLACVHVWLERNYAQDERLNNARSLQLSPPHPTSHVKFHC